MKNSFLLFIILFSNFKMFGQKVDIDNFNFYISNAKTPLNYVPIDQRTFTVEIEGNNLYTGVDKQDAISLYGWQKVEKNGTLLAKVKIGNFYNGAGSSSSRVEEVKDKAGKVTSRTVYYSYSAKNSNSGNITIFGPKKELPVAQKKKEEKKKEEKKNDAPVNPFLKNVDLSANADVVETPSPSSKPVAYSHSLSKDYTYTTSDHLNINNAYEEFRANSSSAANNHATIYGNEFPGWCSNYLNSYYGYMPYQNYVRFKRLDSDKHPEYTTYENAIQATKSIFSKMRYNRPVGDIAKDLEPIIAYFQGLTEKYTKDEKHDKRLRGSAWYNLARIYQYLDQHDKVIEIGNAIIKSEYDEDDGEDFIKESTEIKRVLDFHQMKSRHIVPMTKEQEKDEQGEKQAEGQK